MLGGDGEDGGVPRLAASQLAHLSEARSHGPITDMAAALRPIKATGIRPITAMAIPRIRGTATTHRDLITAITTHGGITTAIRRSGFYPAAHLHERCDLDLPRSARRSCEQQPFEKSPDAKPGLELMVWHKGHSQTTRPLGWQ